MIRVGDLVKLKNIPGVLRTRHESENLTAESVGLVMEWTPKPTCPHTPYGGEGWVLWNGRRDWDIEYEEDLEIVNESR